MCKDGLVYAMASEDMDSLTFATPRLTRNLMKPASANMPVTEYDYDKARFMTIWHYKFIIYRDLVIIYNLNRTISYFVIIL